MRSSGGYWSRSCRRSGNSWSTLSLLALLAAVSLSVVWINLQRYGRLAPVNGETLRSHAIFTRWIIPLHEPEEALSKIDLPYGWHVLVPSGLTNQSCSNCIEYYDLHHQVLRPEHWTQHSPQGFIYRRMAAVLFAIRHGAQQTLFISNVSQVSHHMQSLFIDNEPYGVTGLEYSGPDLTVDFHHFHFRSEIETVPICKYQIRRQIRPIFIVGIRCRASSQAGIAHAVVADEQSPPVFASGSKFSLLSVEDALFEYDGLWAMFTLLVGATNETSVWGLWAQRLLEEMNSDLGLTTLPCPSGSPLIDQPNKPSEGQQAVYRFVNSWSCPHDLDLLECSWILADNLSREGYISETSLQALFVWLLELRALDYTAPKRETRRTSETEDVKAGCVIHSPALVVEGGLSNMPVYSSPHKLFPAIETRCANLPKRLGVTDPFQPYVLDAGDKSRVRDIALVIIFYDSSIYSNIVFLEEMYRNYFNHIIYCGPVAEQFIRFYIQLRRPLSYIEVKPTRGFLAHDCVTRAAMINYRVKGYLEMADDVILNTWTMGAIPRDKFWFQKDLRMANRHQQMMQDFAMTYPVGWWPWTIDGQRWGAKAMAKVWRDLQYMRADNQSLVVQKIVDSFLRTLEINSGSSDLFFYSSSDIFYVPTIYRRGWIFLADLFITHDVFLDVAVPTIMNGLDSTRNIVRLEGTYLWYGERANYPAHYRAFANFFHPWKMGWIHQAEHAHFMCYVILPCIVDDLIHRQP